MAIEKSDKKAQRRDKAIRLIILLLIWGLSTYLGILHQCAQGTRPVGVDALCPFGGIESAFTLITTGTMVQRIAWSSFILLFATLIVAILFRRSFCGNFCPLGTSRPYSNIQGSCRSVVPLQAARQLKVGLLAFLSNLPVFIFR